MNRNETPAEVDGRPATIRGASPAARLAGKVAVITGAGNGIGRIMARVFAAEGASIVVADLHPESAIDSADEINEAGGSSLATCVDVSDPQQVQSMIEAALRRYERIDILVNNAGIALNKPFLETTLQDWQRQLQVNFTGQFICGQAVARVMVKQGRGRMLDELEAEGMTVTHLDRGAFRRAASRVRRQFVDSIGADLIDAAYNFEAGSVRYAHP